MRRDSAVLQIKSPEAGAKAQHRVDHETLPRSMIRMAEWWRRAGLIAFDFLIGVGRPLLLELNLGGDALPGLSLFEERSRPPTVRGGVPRNLDGKVGQS